MRRRFTAILGLASVLAAPVLVAPVLPARAGIAIVIRPSRGVNVDPRTGGFCDPAGCPLGYWNLPVFYGPVLYQTVWYRGPVYYRQRLGEYEYWVAGGWHRNEWDGPPPTWAGATHIGPALGHDYYRQPNWSDWRYWQKKGWQGPR